MITAEVLTGLDMEEEALLQMRADLARRIAEIATVEDAETGYILCREVNRLIDPKILQDAVEIASGLFLNNLPPELQPQKVAGVSNKGKELATAFGLKRNLPIAVTERESQGMINDDVSVTAHYDQEEDKVVIDNVSSFTKRKNYRHVLHGVRPGDNVLIADDFVAFGNVAERFSQGLRGLGINSVFVALVAKDFFHLSPPQMGYRRLREKGSPVFAVVRFTGIENGRVIATAEDI